MTSSCLPNSKQQRETNDRIYDRNLPSQPLQPYLNVRPVMTKYSKLPIVDPRSALSVKMNQLPTYNIHQTFNPGDRSGPWSGYASQVNTESQLRNQVYALQSCDQAIYVPNSSSDLYNNYSFKPTVHYQQHELLFKTEKFDHFNSNPENLGKLTFNNCTRHQVKDMTGKPHCKQK